MNESPLRNVEGFFNTYNRMTQKYEQQYACDGKMKHSTELAVIYHISEHQKDGIEDYYKCEFCENYHTYTLPGMKNLSHKKHYRESEKRNKKGPPKMKMKYKAGRRKR